MCSSSHPRTPALHDDPTRRGNVGRPLHSVPRVPWWTHTITEGKTSQQDPTRIRSVRPENQDKLENR